MKMLPKRLLASSGMHGGILGSFMSHGEFFVGTFLLCSSSSGPSMTSVITLICSKNVHMTDGSWDVQMTTGGTACPDWVVLPEPAFSFRV